MFSANIHNIMKRISFYNSLLLIIAVTVFAACQGKTAQKPDPVQVMTFNIRLDVSSDSLNSWPYRKAGAAHLIAYYAPDLLGMQEVLPNQLADLKQALPQYTALGVGRDDGKTAGEYCPVFFNTARFELLKHGDFSLSEQPETFGVKGWDAECNRVCTWVLLKDKITGNQVAYFNTHLDHIGTVARREGVRLVMQKMQELAPGVPAILTGDFNCGPEEEPSQVLEEGGMKSAWKAAGIAYGPSWSFHDFGRLPLAERPLLDYVYVTPQIDVARCRVIQDTPDEGYYSDHNPVLAEINLK